MNTTGFAAMMRLVPVAAGLLRAIPELSHCNTESGSSTVFNFRCHFESGRGYALFRVYVAVRHI
jgi:hypothetical protein